MSPRLIRGLAVAGAVILLGGVGYALAGRGAGGSSSKTSGISAPLPTTGPSNRTYSSNRATALPSVGTQVVHYRQGGRPATFTAFMTNENFTAANLATKISMQVANARKFVEAPGTSAPSAPTTTPSPTPKNANRIGGMTIARLLGCVTRVAAGRPVMFVERAHYEGRPAMILVIGPQPPGTASFLNVVVVALACSESNGHIITQTTVPTG